MMSGSVYECFQGYTYQDVCSPASVSEGKVQIGLKYHRSLRGRNSFAEQIEDSEKAFMQVRKRSPEAPWLNEGSGLRERNPKDIQVAKKEPEGRGGGRANDREALKYIVSSFPVLNACVISSAKEYIPVLLKTPANQQNAEFKPKAFFDSANNQSIDKNAPVIEVGCR